ncbi:MAG TPA: triose-phosphate isomerase [Candidatus Paceibacterota bacterium]|nr:triose-phosphate isomerase [Candidatus Paceibacterota bacterium]
MKKLIVANWKNHPETLAEAGQILDTVDEYLGSLGEREMSLVFCPPFVFTEEVEKILNTSHLEHQAELGAQDISVDDETALTGDVSGPMLKKLGVRYVIIGHSERRWKLGETDEIVNKKLKAALRNELVPIVCLGERTRLRSLGGQAHEWKDFLRQQAEATFAGLSSDEAARCLIAYEPVWAISTTPGARPDTPGSALESIGIIKEVLNTKYNIQNTIYYLYGGSVTSSNARDFLGSEGIDGVLVGGASIKRDEFVKILAIAAELK